MSIVKSTELLSPQNFVEMLAGNTYIFNGDDDVEEIHALLRQNGIETDEHPLWDYRLDDIDEAVANATPVVLVEVLHWDDSLTEFIREVRWFEVPDDFRGQ